MIDERDDLAGSDLSLQRFHLCEIAMRIGHRIVVGKAIRHRKVDAKIGQPSAQCLPRGAEIDDLLIGEARRKCGLLVHRIGEPSRQVRVCDQVACGAERFDLFPIQRDACDRRAADIVHLLVDPGQCAVEIVNLGVERLDLAGQFAALDALQAIRDNFHGFLKLLQAIAVAVEQADCQWSDGRRQLIPQDLKSRRLLGRDQNALSQCQIMADDIGNGVRLAGAGRPLNNHARPHREPLDDLDLLTIERLGKEQILAAAVGRSDAGNRRDSPV
ncbi:hypothetical protein FHS96_001136 [Sphingomonas zeicaulis]